MLPAKFRGQTLHSFANDQKLVQDGRLRSAVLPKQIPVKTSDKFGNQFSGVGNLQ